MSKFYIKYVPPRRGLEMVEYLQDYLSSINSAVTFSPCFNDNISIFGVLDGSGDDLSKILRTIEGRCAAVRLTSVEFAGASVHVCVPYSGPDLWQANHVYNPNQHVVPTTQGIGPTQISYNCSFPGTSKSTEPVWGNDTITENTIIWTKDTIPQHYIPLADRPNWVTWLHNIGITVVEGDQLNCAKYYKMSLLKEIAKKHFYDDNDSIADLSKSVMAIVVYYPDLTLEDRILVDEQVAILKQIYTKDIAISGLTELTGHLSSILIAYYTAKLTVDAATTIEEVNAVVYE